MSITVKFSKKENGFPRVKFVFKEDLKRGRINGFDTGKIFKGSEFKGDLFQFFPLRISEERTYFLLMGGGERAKFNGDSAFKAGSFLTIKLKELGFRNVELMVDFLERDEKLVLEFFSGIFYGDYENDFFKSQKKENNLTVYIASSSHDKVFRKLIDVSRKIGVNVNLCREFVDLPANHINPITFVDRVKKLLKGSDVKVDLLRLKEIEKYNLNLIKAVSGGSFVEPRLLILEYKNSKDRPIAFIGKGVTFDSGGLNLKPTAHIEDMKTDMAGGAVVFSLIKLLSELKVKANVIGIIPLVENLPGNHATKPGDVFISHSGKSVEILNTDAEGRLILADGIGFSKRFNPSMIVSIATLTGSAVVALGTLRCAIFSKDEDVIDIFKRVGDEIGEKLWPLPMDDEYGEELKSDIADIKNIGSSRFGGAILGAKFLENFSEDTPFVHLDIAGVSDLKSKKPYAPKGGTGFGVRLLYNFMREYK